MKEVTGYLKKNEEESNNNIGKQKLLVVDDSGTIRQAMKEIIL